MKNDELIEAFAMADRQSQLTLLAGLIHWLTILARDLYEPAKSEQLQIINEHNHRLAGHLRDLIGQEAPVESWRLESIGGIAENLNPSIRARLCETLNQKTKVKEK